MTRVLIRVNASETVGLGNLRRCEVLITELCKYSQITICSKDKHVFDFSQSKGLEYINASKGQFVDLCEHYNTGFDLMIIDTKECFSFIQLKKLRNIARRVVFIENISEAARSCDMIIFPNAHYSPESVFKSNDVPNIPKIISGWDYIILRDEVRNAKVSSGGGIVITTGGSDPENVINYLANLLQNHQLKITFLIGDFYQQKSKLIKTSKFDTKCFDLGTLAKADLIISTFGLTIYECLYMKKTVASLAHSMENAVGSKTLAERSPLIDLGYFREVSQADINELINNTALPLSPNYREFTGLGQINITHEIFNLL